MSEAHAKLTHHDAMQKLKFDMLHLIDSAEIICNDAGDIRMANGDYKKCTVCGFCLSDIFKNPTCCGVESLREILGDDNCQKE